MKKNIVSLVIGLALVFSLSSCFTNKHMVGEGAKGSSSVSEKQWYALWGLVALNNPDSKKMAGGASDYTIVSTHSFVDLLISAFTNIVSVQVKTIEVVK